MKKLLVGLFLTLASPALAQNYQATQGAGTTFGTKLVGGVNYPQFTMCDPTTPAQCMAVDASGRVTVLQGTSPWVVSNGGTFAVQAAQSGTWTVQPGNTANTTAWLVTGTGGTFPATQSGNWTSRVVGNAGGIFDGATAAAVPANVLYNGINVGGNLAGWTGIATGATVKAATVAIVDASGNQITSFGGSGGTASNFGSAFPTAGTAVGFTDGTNMVAGRVGAVANVAAATNFVDALGICNYNATPLTVTDTRYQSIQCDVNGFLKVNVTNTNSNITPGDGVATGTYSGASPTIGVPFLWNGTSYDRLKSVATGVAAVGGTGTAGTAATNVLTVQGIASMTPLLSNPGTAANWGVGATAAAVPANAVYLGFNSGGNLVGPATATPLPVRAGDGTRQAVLDPCEANAQSYANGVITSATTTRIITPSASNKTYICSMLLTASAADNVGIVEGTGGTCVTGTAGVVGGTTAANGPNFTANGGLMMQAGGKTAVAQTAGTNVDFCLITSTAGPLTYSVKYVQAP